jgi:2-polyprenyl-3-methyl-5-hydroxy-6-metoxy-1,4-benzoquinol methylase
MLPALHRSDHRLRFDHGDVTVFRELQQINERPGVFSQMTIAALWTDPHVSEQMLRYHLDGSVALSSGTTEFIEASVAWMRKEFHLSGQSRVLDLGCGPGLYSNSLARAGIDVTGVDFSSRSIAYARETAAREGLSATYEIVEVDRTRTIYNWLAHFDPDRLAAELAAAGLAASSVLGDVTGRPFDPASAQFAVIALRDSGWG